MSFYQYRVVFICCLLLLTVGGPALWSSLPPGAWQRLLQAIQSAEVEQAAQILQSAPSPLSEQQLDGLLNALPDYALNETWVPMLQGLYRQHESNWQLGLAVAKANLNGNQIDQAMQSLAALVEKHPQNVEVLYQASLHAYSKKQLKWTEKWTYQLLELQPDHIEGTFLKGSLLSHRGAFDQARQLFTEVLQQNPKHRLARFELGLLENQAGHAQAAETHLRRVIQTQPFFTKAYHALLVALARQNKPQIKAPYQKAADYLKQWSREKELRLFHYFHNPQTISNQAAFTLARELSRVGREDLAQKFLEDRMAQGKASQAMKVILAQIYFNQGSYKPSFELQKQIDQAGILQSEFYAGLRAWTLYRLEKIEECRSYVESILTKHPKSTRLNALKRLLEQDIAPSELQQPPSSTKPPGQKPNPEEPSPEAIETDASSSSSQPTQPPPHSTQKTQGFRFADVAKPTGLHQFQHRMGHVDKRWIIDAMGSGVSVADYDNDGDDDIYLVNGRPHPGQPDSQWQNQLFRNEGGKFVDVTQQAGVGDLGFGMAALFGDVNNDGWLDLFVANYGPNALYKNNGDGTFTNITEPAGLGNPGYAAAAAFGDIDTDGDLDLYVGNYVDFDYQNPEHTGLRGSYHGETTFAGPLYFQPQPDRLYFNNGDGTFSQRKNAGINPALGRAMGAQFFDMDQDRDLDLYITNDMSFNFVLENQGDGTFTDISFVSGGAFTKDGMEGASMGVVSGDGNNDGRLDLHITSYERQSDLLFYNSGDGQLVDSTGQSELLEKSFMLITWGNLWADFDSDGWMDLFTANGHLYPQIKPLNLEQKYAQGVSFYRNLNGSFVDITQESQLQNFQPQNGRGAAMLDYDSDGDLDIVVNTIDDSPQLLDNQTNQDNWLQVQLDEPSATTYGVRLTAQTKNQTFTRMISGGSGYLSQSTSIVHFGLGNAHHVDNLTIFWLDGITQTLQDIPANQKIIINKQ